MPIRVLDRQPPLRQRIVDHPPTMVRVLVVTALVMLAAGLLWSVVFLTFDGFGAGWRTWTTTMLFGQAVYAPIAAVCVVAATTIGLIRRLRRSLAADLQEVAPALRARLVSRRPNAEP